MIKIRPKHKIFVRQPKEVRFQRQLSLAFEQMKVGQVRFIRKIPGTIYTSVFPKNTPIITVPPELENLLTALNLDPMFARNSFIRGQIYDYLKNSCAHGGDALVAVRKYHAYKGGRIRKILEVIVWDNGPGIENLAQALKNGYSSKKDPFNSLAGMGLGIDRVIGYVESGNITPYYIADELKIETGYQTAHRKFNSDRHHLVPSGIKVPGTKTTARFWL